MNNMYFRGLEKKLSEGYYIIVCSGNNSQLPCTESAGLVLSMNMKNIPSQIYL